MSAFRFFKVWITAAALFLFAGAAFGQCTLFGILKTGNTCRSASQSFYTTNHSGASYNWVVPGTSYNVTTSSNSVTIYNGSFSPGSYTMTVTSTCGTTCSCTTGYASTSFTISSYLCPAVGGEGSEEGAQKQGTRAVASMLEPVAPEKLSALLANGGNFWAFAEKVDLVELVNLGDAPATLYLAFVDQEGRNHAELLSLKGGEGHALSFPESAQTVYALGLTEFAAYADNAPLAVQIPWRTDVRVEAQGDRIQALDAQGRAHYPLFGLTKKAGTPAAPTVDERR